MMPSVIAHFTIHELPGTLALVALGLAAGLALGTRARARRSVLLVLALALPLLGLAAAADPLEWSSGVKLAIDVSWLAASIGLVAAVASGHRSADATA